MKQSPYHTKINCPLLVCNSAHEEKTIYTYLVGDTLIEIAEEHLQNLVLEIGKPPRKWQFRAQLETYLKATALTSEQIKVYEKAVKKGYLTEDKVRILLKYFRKNGYHKHELEERKEK